MQRKNPHTGCRPHSLFGAWAIEPNSFQRMYDIASGVDLAALAERNRASKTETTTPEGDALYEVDDIGIARLTITGPMTKYVTSFDAMFGGCSTLMLRRAVRAAMLDNNVAALLLDIDSPGGSVAGTPDLADEVFAFRSVKPVIAYVSDLCCSAAYWVASQTDTIWTGAASRVGNIGAYCLLEDTTGLQEKTGLKLRLVKSAPYKGLGADGVVSDELIEDVQIEVNGIHALFVEAVARGRGIDAAAVGTLADGRTHLGNQAVALNLADEVGTIDDAYNALTDFLAAPAMAAAE